MPPPWPSASAIATRFATHWIADALAGDESLEFSVLQALVRAYCSSEPLAGAPEATRERVALRSLQEVSSLIAAGGDAAAAAGLLRVDGARSCEDVLFRLIREVESSGKLEKDLLPPFSQDIQETICTKKFTLPETSFQLLKGVDPWITSMTVQTAPVSQNCNVTLHDKTSEANCFSEQKNEKNRTDVQKDNFRTSIPSSSKDRDGESAKKTSNEEKSEDTSPEICVRSKDQDIDDTLEGLPQQDLCIKCGKDGQLLKCSGCSLAAHDTCFGSSVTFEGTDLFYCPVCFYKKATEAYEKAKKTYCEARKNLAAFVGTAQVSKQHDEQLNGVQRGAANGDGHSNGCDTSKRTHENEAYNLAHRDEEPHQQRKKQKINAGGNGYPKEVLTEKVPFQNSGLASPNKHSVLQNNSKTRVKDPEKKQQAGHKEARKEAGNDNSCHETRASSQRRCDPPSNQDVEADQEDGLTASNQSGGSDELEATSSHDFGKRSSPPWRNMRHSKKRLQEKESAVSSKSRKPIAKQDQHMPTSPRKRNSVHPQKRYSNPVAPTGRRKKLAWTEEEAAVLREAMAKFTPQNDAQIPWIQILEYGSGVFHRTRLPSDLRVKWRNMKKNDAGNLT